MSDKTTIENLEKLTPMELKVLRHISENKTSKEIAEILFISPRTVQNHRYNIVQKLNLKGANKLLEFALTHRDHLHPIIDTTSTQTPQDSANTSIYLIGGLVIIALLITAVFFFWPDSPSPSVENQDKNNSGTNRIAVMPFRLIGPDSSENYLSDGLTEALITQLSQIPALSVIARTSVMPYKRSPKSLPEIARDLRIAALLEGSVQREDHRIRISVQLIDALKQETLWGQTFDRQYEDILSIQRDIALKVATALEVRLFLDELDGDTSPETVNEQAHIAYLKGRYFLNQTTREGFRRAITFYQSAIAIDSSYARAWAGLADAYAWMSNYGFMSPVEAYAQSRFAANVALRLAPNMGEAHTAAGTIALLHDWDFQSASLAFQKALALNPSDVVAHRLSALLLLSQKNYEEALTHTKATTRLDPLSLISNSIHGRTLYFSRQFPEAIAQFRTTLEIDSTFWLTHAYLGEAHLAEGAFEPGLKRLQTASDLAEENSAALARLGYGYALTGKRKSANRILQQLLETSAEGNSLAFQIALIYTALEEQDNAFEWIEVAYQNRHDFMLDLPTDPKLDPLRSDERFTSFLQKMAFEN